VRVIKHCENGIVRRGALIDDAGRDVVPVTRFLSHLMDANYSPNTVCAYAYDRPRAQDRLHQRRARRRDRATDGQRAPVPSHHRHPTRQGGARLQTMMAVLGHKSPAMSLIYASLSAPTVNALYQAALERELGPDLTLAGPAAQALREYQLDPDAVHWLQTNFLKAELELGHCLRLPAEGPCECDLVLSCSKFLTTSAYAPRLRAAWASRSSSSPTRPNAAAPARSSVTRPRAVACKPCSTSSATRNRRWPALPDVSARLCLGVLAQGSVDLARETSKPATSSEIDSPPARNARTCASVSFAGRPLCFPRARAAARARGGTLAWTAHDDEFFVSRCVTNCGRAAYKRKESRMSSSMVNFTANMGGRSSAMRLQSC